MAVGDFYRIEASRGSPVTIPDGRKFFTLSVGQVSVDDTNTTYRAFARDILHSGWELRETFFLREVAVGTHGQPGFLEGFPVQERSTLRLPTDGIYLSLIHI